MTPFIDLPAYLDVLSTAIYIPLAVLALIAVRALVVWRMDHVS